MLLLEHEYIGTIAFKVNYKYVCSYNTFIHFNLSARAALLALGLTRSSPLGFLYGCRG